VKTVSRRDEAALEEVDKLLNAAKYWDSALGKAKAAGHQWLLAGLEGYQLTKLCYVDLVLFWKVREHVPLLEELGCTHLAEHVKKVSELEGFVRLVESGRLMPNIAQPGYTYKECELVKQP